MREKKVATVVSNFEDKYRTWLKSQEDQTSAYEYEKSYVEFMQQVSQDTLIKTTSSELRSRNSKKKFRQQ